MIDPLDRPLGRTQTREVDDEGAVPRAVREGGGRGVDESRLAVASGRPKRERAAALVDVSKGVDLGLKPGGELAEEVEAARALSFREAEIADAEGRAVRDEDLRV